MKNAMEKNSRMGGKRAGLCLTAACLLAITAMLTVFGCDGDKGNDGENKQDMAKRLIRESLILPPDAKLRNESVQIEQNSMVIGYGSNEPVEIIEEFFNKAIKKSGNNLVSSSPSGISYINKDKRQITVMWFSRDPDLSEFKSVFHVVVYPLPPELKQAAE